MLLSLFVELFCAPFLLLLLKVQIEQKKNEHTKKNQRNRASELPMA